MTQQEHTPLQPHWAAPAFDATTSTVGRTLAAGAPGTVRLKERFGPALITVRYRHDWTGLYRYTTVELLVDAVRVTRGNQLTRFFAVRLKRDESALIRKAKALGARWDPGLLCWLMRGHAVQALGLAHRVEWAQTGQRLKMTERPSGMRR